MSNARRRQNEILRNGILYLTCATGNKVPIKKTEFIKRVFETDKRIKTVQTLLNKMKRVLKNVFGLKIEAFNDATGEFSSDIAAQQNGFSLWFVISEVKGITSIVKKVMKNGNSEESAQEDQIEETKQAMLVMFLSIILMQNAELGVEESQLWNTMKSFEFDQILELAEKDFKKFLKTEYVSPMYLKAQDHTNEQEGVTVTKYIWGPRATLEFSKWSLFKHVIKQFPGTKPTDYPAQLQLILNSDEKVVAKKEMQSWEIYGNDTDSSVSNNASDNDAENEDEMETDNEEGLNSQNTGAAAIVRRKSRIVLSSSEEEQDTGKDGSSSEATVNGIDSD